MDPAKCSDCCLRIHELKTRRKAGFSVSGSDVGLFVENCM